MKKIYFLAVALVAMAFSACEHIEPEVPAKPDKPQEWEEVVVNYAKQFTFTVKGDFSNVEFIDGTLNAGEKTTRAGNETRASNETRSSNEYMKADGSEMTDLWVVDVVRTSANAEGTGAAGSGTGEWTIKQMLHQTPADADWGQPKMSLTLGHHHVMFLASRGADAVYQDGVVTWSKVRDTFWKDYEVEVVKTSNGNRAVTLDRAVTKLKLVMEDALPNGLTRIDFEPELWYTGWDMVHGVPVAAESGSKVEVQIPSSAWGLAGVDVSAWSLSVPTEWTTSVGVKCYSGSNVTTAVTLSDVPMMANRTSVYRGNMFTASTANGVQLNTEWAQDYEGRY